MEKQKIIKDINRFLLIQNEAGIVKSLEKIVKLYGKVEASIVLSELFTKNYDSSESVLLANTMSSIIRSKQEIFTDVICHKYILLMCVNLGSDDFYKCFINDIALPYLEGKEDVEKEDYFSDLWGEAERFSNSLFPKYKQWIKGKQYIGEFGSLPDNSGVLMVAKDDYETMELIIQAYNSIIGRRDIIKDLQKRSGVDID